MVIKKATSKWGGLFYNEQLSNFYLYKFDFYLSKFIFFNLKITSVNQVFIIKY